MQYIQERTIKIHSFFFAHATKKGIVSYMCVCEWASLYDDTTNKQTTIETKAYTAHTKNKVNI